ncbi:sorting nexin-16 [Biomphalaria glabrata]|uniref:PX domain-containing protein n=1 Tax=Biomphalaria glabrata TaxID=6526 RepID=A0A2C9LRH7_BIOGL|nr:sorting nexin-16 [Biomphalaria glabrata]
MSILTDLLVYKLRYRMANSDDDISLSKNEDGNISASYDPKKGYFNKDSNREDSPGTSPGSQSENVSISDLQNATDSSVLIHTENQDLGEPSLTSTPIARLNSQTSYTVMSDRAPLLRSAALDACLADDMSELSCGCSDPISSNGSPTHGSMNNILVSSQSQNRDALMMPGAIRVPIIGHETMEARSKFTVFKIHVMMEEDDLGWFIFRRYSDFCHLNDQLAVLFPNFRLSLPPKRWFRSNFDIEFLEERQLGLQAFLNNITGHRDICNSQPVRDFFCFDDPPGAHDSLEESRAQCESMEELVYRLRKELTEKVTEISLLKEENELFKNQVQLLSTRLSELNNIMSKEKSADKRRSLTGSGLQNLDSVFGSGDIMKSLKQEEKIIEAVPEQQPAS